MTIWKYEIPDRLTFELELPAGARFLSAQLQGLSPQMWFLLDPSRSKQLRRFVIAMTGGKVPDPEKLQHLSTLQMGAIVVHLFEYDRRDGSRT